MPVSPQLLIWRMRHPARVGETARMTTEPNADLRAAYAWARVGRERLLTWLESLPGDVYTLERPDFAFGSLRNVQVHVADCYRVWIAERGLGETVVRHDPRALPDRSEEHTSELQSH